MQQFDNEGAFCGGHANGRVISQVARVCLFYGIEPLFTSFDDARRNCQIEAFHSIVAAPIVELASFRDLAHVQRLTPILCEWYQVDYRPPRRGSRPIKSGRTFACAG